MVEGALPVSIGLVAAPAATAGPRTTAARTAASHGRGVRMILQEATDGRVLWPQAGGGGAPTATASTGRAWPVEVAGRRRPSGAHVNAWRTLGSFARRRNRTRA